MLKKKTKGVLVIEATIAFTIFVSFFAWMLLAVTEYTFHGYFYTAAASATQAVNNAAQVINALDMGQEDGQTLSDEDAMRFAAFFVTDDIGDAYGPEAIKLFKDMGTISRAETVKLLEKIYEQELKYLTAEYISANMHPILMKPEDILVTNFSITDDNVGKKLEADVTYTLHYSVVSVNDLVKDIHICTYIE